GFVALDLERAVYPSSLTPVLKNLEYQVDVDSEKAHQSMELFIKNLNRTNEARIALYRHLWDETWKTFMLVFTGTDRLMHFLWDACEDEDNAFHKEFNDYFRRIDEVIGEIAGKIGDEDNLIMLSDHGFERLGKDVYINSILKKEGFLKFKEDKTANFSGIDYDTKAFALDPARIYVNLKGKYPRGSVAVEEREKVIRDLKDIFKNFEINGRKVVKRIYGKEEAYDGPYFDQAPDLVLIGNKGYNLKAAINSENIYSNGIFTGKHTEDDAFLLIGKKVKDDIISAYPGVGDVVSIINRLQGEDI
ncbi:MAG: alkaline phosphatase family protein, partial [Candidatus Omnitrophota bacterium]|nr:alkaline phosphatase family protein [Candidatus Omnitrophota bacterium]